MPVRRPVTAFRIHCPVEQRTIQAWLAGDAAALDSDHWAGPLLAILRGDNAIGDFGIYRNVVEVAFGAETFMPTGEAQPTVGEAGGTSHVLTAVLTTYADADAAEAELAAVLDALIDAHPWEVPVIEMYSAFLLVPDPDTEAGEA